MQQALESSALGPWAQGQDGLTRACPVVVILVVPPLCRQAFFFHFHFHISSRQHKQEEVCTVDNLSGR